MDIETFVRETLVGIKNGVRSANSEIRKNGKIDSDHFHIMPFESKDQNVIVFDIAVTVSNKKGKKGTGGIKIAGIGFGGGLEGEVKNEYVSRIKFSITPAIFIK